MKFDVEFMEKTPLVQSFAEKLNLKPTSTGTTLAGIIFKDGVILGADTRATNGPIVADKNCEKIHYISDNIFCCGAGTAADTQYTTEAIAYELEFQQLETNRQPRVVTALTMLKQYLFQYQGHIGAALVLGGVDFTGPRLFTVFPHGSTDTLPFVVYFLLRQWDQGHWLQWPFSRLIGDRVCPRRRESN